MRLIRSPNAPITIALAMVILLAPFPAWPEKADKDKPTQIEANRMNSDDARRVTIFEGNVILTKGTILVRGDRIMVRQDAEGFQFTTATGGPARFRQKREGRDEWIEGEALRIELDDRNEKIELHQSARMLRDQDEVRGELISLDTRSEFFSVTGAKGPGTGSGPAARVRAVIQPKAQDPEAAKSAPAPAAPAAKR